MQRALALLVLCKGDRAEVHENAERTRADILHRGRNYDFFQSGFALHVCAERTLADLFQPFGKGDGSKLRAVPTHTKGTVADSLHTFGNNDARKVIHGVEGTVGDFGQAAGVLIGVHEGDRFYFRILERPGTVDFFIRHGLPPLVVFEFGKSCGERHGSKSGVVEGCRADDEVFGAVLLEGEGAVLADAVERARFDISYRVGNYVLRIFPRNVLNRNLYAVFQVVQDAALPLVIFVCGKIVDGFQVGRAVEGGFKILFSVIIHQAVEHFALIGEGDRGNLTSREHAGGEGDYFRSALFEEESFGKVGAGERIRADGSYRLGNGEGEKLFASGEGFFADGFEHAVRRNGRALKRIAAVERVVADCFQACGKAD